MPATSVRSAYARADRYLREHPGVYAFVLFLAMFAVVTGAHLWLGEAVRSALVRGTIYGVGFAVTYTILQRAADTGSD